MHTAHNDPSCMIRFLAILLGVLPLLWIPALHQQFELPKFLFLLAGVGILLMGFAYQTWKRTSWQLIPTQILVVGGMGILYLILQTAFGALVPDVSLWGSYQRHSGLLLWVVLATLFILVVVHPWRNRDVQWFVRTIVLFSTFTALFAVFQGIQHIVTGNLALVGGRVFGTFGIPNFLGQWLLLTIPFSLLCVLQAKSIRQKLLFGAASLLQVCSLLLTQNRASLVILVLLLFSLGFALLWKSKTHRWLISGMGITLFLLVSVVGIGRVDGVLRSVQTRAYLYPMGVDAVIAAPPWGYGLDAQYTVFAERLPADLSRVEPLGFVPDKVHQLFIDTLIELGWVGAGFFIVFLFVVFRQIFQGFSSFEEIEKQRMFAFFLSLISWTLSLLVSFPGIAERVFVTVLLGVMVARTLPEQRKTLSFWILPPLIITGIGLLVLAHATFIADLAYAKLRDVQEPHALQSILSATPMHLEYAVFGANGDMPSVTIAEREQALHYALRKNPYDPWAWVFYADVRSKLGDVQGMRRALEEGKAACSNCSFVALKGAQLEQVFGNEARAQEWAQTYWNLLPDFIRDSSLPVDPSLGERRRIIWKEQKADIDFISALLQKNAATQ